MSFPVLQLQRRPPVTATVNTNAKAMASKKMALKSTKKEFVIELDPLPDISPE